MSKAYIIDAVRTPRGKGKMGKGALTNIHPQELLGQTLNALAARTGVNRSEVDDVVMGCVSQASEQGGDIATSKQMLVTAIARARNTGMKFNEAGDELPELKGVSR